ncbi:MAG: hypothetical protein ACLBM1_02620, partial [Cuspidothrix sp.]
QFTILRRPPISRRQLHLMVFSKGGNRRKYGGTITRHGFRKGDFVEANQGQKTFFGWVSGDREKQVSVSDFIAVDRVVRTSVNHETLTTRGFYF